MMQMYYRFDPNYDSFELIKDGYYYKFAFIDSYSMSTYEPFSPLDAEFNTRKNDTLILEYV